VTAIPMHADGGVALQIADARDEISQSQLHLATRRVLQWKEVSNQRPNLTTKPIIERTLTSVAGLRAQLQTEGSWRRLNAPF